MKTTLNNETIKTALKTLEVETKEPYVFLGQGPINWEIQNSAASTVLGCSLHRTAHGDLRKLRRGSLKLTSSTLDYFIPLRTLLSFTATPPHIRLEKSNNLRTKKIIL